MNNPVEPSEIEKAWFAGILDVEKQPDLFGEIKERIET